MNIHLRKAKVQLIKLLLTIIVIIIENLPKK